MNKITLSVLFLLSSYAHAAITFCEEKPITVLEEFFPMPFGFGPDRSTVDASQTDPIVKKITAKISSDTSIKITEINVFSSMSHLPFLVEKDGKKTSTVHPDTDKLLNGIAKSRRGLIEQSLVNLKQSTSALKDTTLVFKHGMAGPEFLPVKVNDVEPDMNLKFVSALTPGFKGKVEELFETYSDEYKSIALINSATELLNNSSYTSLLEMKFRPFNGIRVKISGVSKCDSKKPGAQAAPALKQ